MARPSRRAVLRALALTALPVAAPVTGCALVEDRTAYSPGPVELVTGGTRGVYYAFGTEVARVAAAALPDAPITAVATSGSVDNLQRVVRSPRVLAFSALDAAAEAVAGTGPFPDPLDLRAVARVYDDYLHVVVRRDSALTSLDDLRGRRVSVGATGSGTALIAGRVLDAAGVGLDGVQALDLGIDESLDALGAAAVDAFFWSGGLPTGGVADLARTVPLRLLPVEDPVRVLRQQGYAVYRAATVPAEEYGQPVPVETLAVPNVLVVRADAETGLVRAVTGLLFDRRAEIAATVPLAGALDRRSAIFTSPLELHPGALAHYRARG